MLTERQKRLLTEIPKAENHIHIEGSIPWDLALRLAEKNHVQLPYHTLEEMRTWTSETIAKDGLNGFIDTAFSGLYQYCRYCTCCSCFQTLKIRIPAACFRIRYRVAILVSTSPDISYSGPCGLSGISIWQIRWQAISDPGCTARAIRTRSVMRSARCGDTSATWVPGAQTSGIFHPVQQNIAASGP